jgi:hypothetical protein
MSFSYARGEISSFVRCDAGAYIARMKFRYPTSQELYQVEQEARRLRALEMARLFRAAAAAVRGLFAVKVKVKGLRHA